MYLWNPWNLYNLLKCKKSLGNRKHSPWENCRFHKLVLHLIWPGPVFKVSSDAIIIYKQSSVTAWDPCLRSWLVQCFWVNWNFTMFTVRGVASSESLWKNLNENQKVSFRGVSEIRKLKSRKVSWRQIAHKPHSFTRQMREQAVQSSVLAQTLMWPYRLWFGLLAQLRKPVPQFM